MQRGQERDLERGWAPRPVLVVAALAGAAVLGWAATRTDAGGRVLTIAAAALLAAEAVRAGLLRPVLTAGPDGLTVVTGLRRRRFAWSDVRAVTAVRGRRGVALEVDAGDAVLVLPSWRLGADPVGVAAQLEVLREGG